MCAVLIVVLREDVRTAARIDQRSVVVWRKIKQQIQNKKAVRNDRYSHI